MDFQEVLWRFHRTRGPHSVAWDALREYGLLPTTRYDPQPAPAGLHSEGVTYAAVDLATALAEVFQVTRVVDTTSWAPQATAWVPRRPLRLSEPDTETWALRNGAALALSAAPRRTCRHWA
ncbi:MAG: RES domain-containing protein [Pauljensenia sp.]